MVFWCLLKTKQLRTPFSLIIMSLAFSNGISTTFVGPMEISRVFVLYAPVSHTWCTIRILLRTFCFNVSLLVIFTIAALRLYAGVCKKELKSQLTHKRMGITVGSIYLLAAMSSPILLNRTGAAYLDCMGQSDVHRLRLHLNSYPEESTEDNSVTSSLDYEETSGNYTRNSERVILFTESELNITSATVMPITNESIPSDVNSTENSLGTMYPIFLWKFYFVMSVGLFLTTVICYIALYFVLCKHRDTIQHQTIADNRTTLTLRVATYVTCSFFASFLVPFFPAIVIVPVQATAANLHYVALFHCLSSIDAALFPLIYHFTNYSYRKSLPKWVKKLNCCITNQVSPS